MNGFSILAWRIPWTVVHGVIKSQTQKSDFDFASLHQGEEKGNIMFRLWPLWGLILELPSSSWVGTWVLVEQLKGLYQTVNCIHWRKTRAPFYLRTVVSSLLFHFFLNSVVPSRSLITATCSRTSTVARRRSQKGWGLKWLALCPESHARLVPFFRNPHPVFVQWNWDINPDLTVKPNSSLVLFSLFKNRHPETKARENARCFHFSFFALSSESTSAKQEQGGQVLNPHHFSRP